MKIYKLDIDASKPIRKVVQMQQNATGALSVDVSNDGKYIRNLSCALYDGGTELSAYTTTDVGAGYKIDMGNETKVVKFTAQSTPIECSAQYIVKNGTTRIGTEFLSRVQLSTGVYRQDEFYGLAQRFGSNSVSKSLVPTSDTSSNVNFDTMMLLPWLPEKPVAFYVRTSNTGLSYTKIPDDTLISVDGYVEIGENAAVKRQGLQLSSYTYPAVGYYTDYALDTVIRPSENAHCFAEHDVSDPTPDPEPEPEPEPEPTPEQGE